MELGQAFEADSEILVERCARAAHEVNRVYCEALGDVSQVKWRNAPLWQRDSARNGVRAVLDGASAEASHENWMAEKLDAGWRYGEVKDADARTHPCIVAYADLPLDQRAKDSIYGAVVRQVAWVIATYGSTSPAAE